MMRAILTYHSIDRSGSVISMSPETFRRHAEWLAGSGVAVTALDELVSHPGSGPAVALTFDDAFANFATEAWPVLDSLGLPVTLFVPSGHVGGRNAWEDGGSLPVLPLLDWEALARLAEQGVRLGAHGHTHVDMRRTSAEELATELDLPRRRIEAETGFAAVTVAYPYGGVDDRVAREARKRYGLGVTTDFALLEAGADPARLPRLDAWYFREPGRLERFGTPPFARFVGIRRRLRRVRRMWTGG